MNTWVVWRACMEADWDGKHDEDTNKANNYFLLFYA